jgi:hypothetical protein
MLGPSIVRAEDTGLLPFVSNLNTKEMSTKAPVIVIGFVGGFVRHDDSVHFAECNWPHTSGALTPWGCT